MLLESLRPNRQGSKAETSEVVGGPGRGDLHENEERGGLRTAPFWDYGTASKTYGMVASVLVLEVLDVYFPIESDMILAVPLGNPPALFCKV